MHKTQSDYAKAKAEHETLKARRTEEMKMWEAKNGRVTRKSDKEHVDHYFAYSCEVENGLGYWPAVERREQAEKAMVKWATEEMERLASPEDMKRIRAMVAQFEVYDMQPKHRQELIDMSFRLAAK